MAEKRFFGPVEGLDPAALAADRDSAAVFDKLRVGRLAVYYRDGFRVKAIPYSRMERARNGWRKFSCSRTPKSSDPPRQMETQE